MSLETCWRISSGNGLIHLASANSEVQITSIASRSIERVLGGEAADELLALEVGVGAELLVD